MTLHPPSVRDWLAGCLFLFALLVMLPEDEPLVVPEAGRGPLGMLRRAAGWLRSRRRFTFWAEASDDPEEAGQYFEGLNPDREEAEADSGVRVIPDRETVSLFPVPVVRPRHRHRPEPPGPVTLRTGELPCLQGQPLPPHPSGQKPPWEHEPAEEPSPLPPPQAWQPGDHRDPPTIVMKAIRPGIEDDLGPYLDGLPKYDDGQ